MFEIHYSEITRRGRGATQLYDFSINDRIGVRVEKAVAAALARRACIAEDAMGSPIAMLRVHQPELVALALRKHRPGELEVRINADDVQLITTR